MVGGWIFFSFPTQTSTVACVRLACEKRFNARIALNIQVSQFPCYFKGRGGEIGSLES
jgi:hypothetical protein